ncbi:hypothetical protein NDU88_002033 [Pleurodeles waltl]|uniref:Uncharacterized protein n=1 Tax=Pleurodeles waltl TaxID=8319 RepID=A0AAV7MUG4_PLEWA|nr:hypothetical protein NDU88_002033 [Pleurodeles waltl]
MVGAPATGVTEAGKTPGRLWRLREKREGGSGVAAGRDDGGSWTGLKAVTGMASDRILDQTVGELGAADVATGAGCAALPPAEGEQWIARRIALRDDGQAHSKPPVLMHSRT